MVDSASEMCGSVRVGGKNSKNVWWNNVVKTAVKRNEVAWKGALGARDERQMYGGLQRRREKG